MSRKSVGGRGRPPLALLALVAMLTFTVEAAAQRVVLVRPERSDPVLIEAFNRLRGELGMHGFEVLVVSGADAPSAAGLARFAEDGQAVASVSFILAGAGATADIWLSDRVTGKTSIRTISTAGSSDAASLLALRAVELLRASLREYGPERSAPADVVEARPDRAQGVVKRWSKPPEPSRSSAPWRLGAEIVCALPLPVASPSFGPGISFGRELTETFGLGLVLAGPMLGSRLETGDATASARHELGLSELHAALWRPDPLRVDLRVSLGVVHLSARGDAGQPWRGRSDSAWLGTAGGGLGISLAFTPQVSAEIRWRVLGTLPAAGVRLADERHAIDRPLVLASVGLETSF